MLFYSKWAKKKKKRVYRVIGWLIALMLESESWLMLESQIRNLVDA